MKKAVLKLCLIGWSVGITFTSCKIDEDDIPIAAKHYFKFKSCHENSHGNWQDTSFVAATSNPFVIQQCLDQLELPAESRTLFPLGEIENGSLGYNKNGTHIFNWHFVEDSWEMVELGIEIYDGCAYSDVELTNYVENVGSYGGWSNIVLEEIINP